MTIKRRINPEVKIRTLQSQLEDEQARNDELAEENERLLGRLQCVSQIADPSDLIEEDEDDDEDDEDEDEDEDDDEE